MTAIPRPGSVSFEDRVTKAVPYDWGFGSTPRTANLRDALYWKAAVVKDFVNVLMGQGKMEFRRGILIHVDLPLPTQESIINRTEQSFT